jgi:ribosomal-protein-alanine N-acetyltransferase
MIARLFHNPVVEGLSPRDAGVLAEIHRDAFRRNWSADDFLSLLSEPTVFALGVRLRPLIGTSRLVAFVLVRFTAGEAEILTIAVRPGHRRRGYGRLLMDDVLRRLYREHIATLFLEVDRANSAAVGLYRKLGFAVAGERRNYYAAPHAGDGTALVMRLQVR